MRGVKAFSVAVAQALEDIGLDFFVTVDPSVFDKQSLWNSTVL